MGVGPDLPGVIRPAQVGREVAAAVHRADVQPGVAVEQAGEDEPRERDGRLHRVAHCVGQVVVGEPLAEGAAPRVHDHQRAEPLRGGPEVGQRRVVELPPAGHRSDLNPAQPELPDTGVQLADRELRVLQRHRPDADQPVGVPAGEPSHPLVGGGHQPLGQVLLGPRVVERHGRDELEVDPRPIHRLEPTRHVGEQRPYPGQLSPVHRRGLLAEPSSVPLLLPRVLGVSRDHRLGRRHESVRVHVDGGDVDSGDSVGHVIFHKPK